MAPNPSKETVFRFKQFAISNNLSAMKIGTDGVLLGGWTGIPEGRCRVLDIGTGTGLVALMVAQRSRLATIVAVEVDMDAAVEAERNRLASPFADRIEIKHDDFVKWNPGTKFDLIVSNPPFFNESLKSPNVRRAKARHEMSLPLEVLLSKSYDMLAEDGILSMIYPCSRDDEVTYLATMPGLHIHRHCRVYTIYGKPPQRTLWQFSKNTDSYKSENLYIKTIDGKYSEEYMSLLKDFYIHF